MDILNLTLICAETLLVFCLVAPPRGGRGQDAKVEQQSVFCAIKPWSRQGKESKAEWRRRKGFKSGKKTNKQRKKKRKKRKQGGLWEGKGEEREWGSLERKNCEGEKGEKGDESVWLVGVYLKQRKLVREKEAKGFGSGGRERKLGRNR